jgi:DNA-binding YbaB/EbfC family protein
MMDFAKLGAMKDALQKAQEMRVEMEQKLATTVVEGSAGGGLVTARMNGRKELLKLTIDPANVSGSLTPGDVEMLQDLITAAVNDAGRKVDDILKGTMQNAMKDVLPAGLANLLGGE